MRDLFGVEILPSDTVAVVHSGYGARLADCGVISPVVALGRSRVTVVDADAQYRAVSARVLGVWRRDGINGYEGNRSR